VLPCWTTPIGQHAAWDLDLLDFILSSVVPLFFVMALGYLAGWLREMPARR
jgi:hypothetical protein